MTAPTLAEVDAGVRRALAAYSGWTPRRPQRHLVLNTHVVRWDEHEAEAASDIVFLLLAEAGWQVQLVGRCEDVLHHAAGTWRFHRRHAELVTGR